MHAKVTIVVDRLHWCCLSCQLKNKHVVSIDAHLQSCHLDLLSSVSDASPDSSPDFELDNVSEEDTDSYNESNDKMADEDLSDYVPSPVPVQRKSARFKKKKKIEGTKSVNKGRTRELLPRSADVADIEQSQEVLSSHLRKNRRSLCRLTTHQKKKQIHQLKSVSRKGKIDSGIAGRKRKTLQVDSGVTDAHEVKEGASKENVKSPAVDKADTDIETSVPKRRRGRPKSSVKPKDTVRKKLKTVDRETKKYCWGGKPVKRSREVAEQEMNGLKICYVSNEQSRNSVGTSVSFVQDGDVCRKKSSDMMSLDRESISENNVEAAKLVTKESTHLSSVQVNGGLKIEDRCDVLSSGTLENDQHLTTDKTSDNAARSSNSVHEKHLDVTEASRTETGVVNGSYKHENDGISHVPFALQVGNENDRSVHQDVQQSNMVRDSKTVTQTPSVTHETMCPPRQWMSTSGCETSSEVIPMQVLPSKDTSNTYSTGDSLENTSQSPSQQDAPEATETSERKQSSLEEQGQSLGPGEWMKSRTPNFSFSKAKRPACIDKPSTSKVHECAVCQAKFSSGEYLSDHVLKMSSHERSECQSCQRLYHNAYDLNFHVFEDHERRSKPFCFTCEEKFQNMAAFEKHLYRHKFDFDPELLDMEYHSCHICQTDIPCRFETLRKHYNKHKKTVCLECFVRSELVLLSDTASVQEHRKVHSNFCNICIQDFTSADALSNHYPCQPENVHKEDGQGTLCDRCNQWCPNKALATLHHKEHRLEGMRKWREQKWAVGIACVYCDKILSNKRNLERHVAHLHSSSRSYSFHCEFCGKGVDSKNILKDHIAVNHLGIKRYCCEYCDQRFSSSTTLRRHTLKEHATDKQYTCEVCGEKFCEKVKLSRHMYIHTGSARFMCEQCGKGFHSRSEFKKHLAVHEEKRCFPCLGCGQEYKRKEHLKRHIQKCSKSVQSNSQANLDMNLPHQ